MSATATAYDVGAMKELSDAELTSIAEGNDSQAEMARGVLGERDETYGSKTKELKTEAGEATGAMPPADPPETPAPELDEIVVDGTSQLEMFDFGGKKATHATFKLTGGKVKIQSGQAFKKGDRVRGTFEAVVNFVGQKDEHDANTGQVTDAEQRHEARLTDLQVERAG